jgi:hypothetical protein
LTVQMNNILLLCLSELLLSCSMTCVTLSIWIVAFLFHDLCYFVYLNYCFLACRMMYSKQSVKVIHTLLGWIKDRGLICYARVNKILFRNLKHQSAF